MLTVFLNNKGCMDLMESFVSAFHEQLDPAVVCSAMFCSNSEVDNILDDAQEHLDDLMEEEGLGEEVDAPITTTEPPTTAPPPKPLPRWDFE